MGFFRHPCGAMSTIAHILQCISSLIVLGITAWAVPETETLTVVFSLVVLHYQRPQMACSPSASDRRSNFLPVSITISSILRSIVVNAHLPPSWLTAFIFLALDFNHVSCTTHLWNNETVCSRKYAVESFSFIAFFTTVWAMAFEVLYTYLPMKDASMQEKENRVMSLEHNLRGAGLMTP
ncbi:unnamed protein product [Penicillium egyptiacum]|uniref:MARVEL domain-containing protein n=1 Tax=Penicillium egyptiacum TaxID=1303716 RepID=A0A9W4KMI1_9EURO|nr:unnamed protein product [Penicillium egyptiacum]